jgi:hypothetical protein
MAPRRKERKRKGLAITLLRDIQGSPAEKLALFQKMKAAGGFANESETEMKAVEELLQTLGSVEKMQDEEI